MSPADVKPRPKPCRACSNKVEAWLRSPVIVRGVEVFSAKWFQDDLCGPCEARERASQEAQLNERLTKERLERAGMGEPRLARFEFKNYRADTKARQRVASMVRPIYTSMAGSGKVASMVLSGGAGTGKTHLAVCFAKAALARGRRVRFWQWSELVLHLRQVNLSNQLLAEVDQLCALDALVLDDLGADKPTEFVVETLYLIVDRWWRLDKPGLIITTNLPIHVLGERYGDRISSRLGGTCALVDFEGCPDGRIEDLRLQ